MPIFDRDHADSPEKAYVYILRCADGHHIIAYMYFTYI